MIDDSVMCFWKDGMWYLKHHMKHHGQSSLSWVFSRDIRSGYVEHIGPSLRTDTMHQHFLPNSTRARNQNWLN